MIDTWNRSSHIFHSEAAWYTSRGVVARSFKAFDYEIHTPFPGPFLELVPCSISFLVKKGNWHQYILYLLHGLMLSHVNVCVFVAFFFSKGLMNLEISMWYQDRRCGMCRAKLGRVDQVKTDWIRIKTGNEKKGENKKHLGTFFRLLSFENKESKGWSPQQHPLP